MRYRVLLLIGALLSGLLTTTTSQASGREHGIYLTQYTLEETKTLNYLIKRAKETGITTFVIDFERPSKRTDQNIQAVIDNGFKYVARVIVFPNGGTSDQIHSKEYLEKRYSLVQNAIDLGADSIQLDYIRFKPTQTPSEQNAKDIHQVIAWFKERVAQQGVPLQVDVFGISSFGSSRYIGQDIKVFADTIDVLCPMVYPSHYEPYAYHSERPYQTVYSSLMAIDQQMNGDAPFKLVPYIEMYNFRYPVANSQRAKYIYSQIKATEDAGSDGWYAWSANNKYDYLFDALEQYPIK